MNDKIVKIDLSIILASSDGYPEDELLKYYDLL